MKQNPASSFANLPWPFIAFSAILLLSLPLHAQHLWWNLEKQNDATCLYGQITVLATNPGIYYCGANWHPGEPAGGYCGIQHNTATERRTIFSIWDTSPQLHSKVTFASPRTIADRFGNEGEGAHTHMIWPWKPPDTFQFFVRKSPGPDDTTNCRYYIFDLATKTWLHVATITNPNGNKPAVTTFAGGLNSFLENFRGRNKNLPKLALYRLWLGKTPQSLHLLRRATGDGTWGQLHNAYFLAEGDKAALDKLFAELKPDYGEPLIGTRGKALDPIPDSPLPNDLIATLTSLEGEK